MFMTVMEALDLDEKPTDKKPWTVAAIILAAGCSSRMGRDNKLLLKIGGNTLVRSAVQNAITSDVHSTIVVLGHEAKKVAASLEGLEYQPQINEEYSQGMASSLRVGVKAAEGFDAVAILLADMPQVESKTLDVLLSVFLQQEFPRIVVATHGGRRGHPVIWPAVCFPDLMTLRGDIGGKQLLQKNAHQVIEADVESDSIFMDIDTRSDLAAANALPAKRP
tara:strand:+ start:1813 stop:2475 length:663 start_codon:yes stop_codon:yes gene_type:complete